MGNRFDAIFGGLLPDTLPEGAAEGKVLSIEVEREKQTVEITAAFDRVIRQEALAQLGRALAQKLQVSCCEIQPRYLPTLFSSDCLPDLIYTLKRKGVLVNGFLDGAKLTLSQGKLEVELCPRRRTDLGGKGMCRGNCRTFAPGVQFDGGSAVYRAFDLGRPEGNPADAKRASPSSDLCPLCP